jgi:hypothetical protein
MESVTDGIEAKTLLIDLSLHDEFVRNTGNTDCIFLHVDILSAEYLSILLMNPIQ